MSKRLLDSKEDGLIPGLPDDVSLQCLARISHGFEGVMQCVSKKWKDAFQSEAIGRIRALEGLSGDWLFVHTFEQPVVGWQAYDPAADRWHPLPPVPGFSPHYQHIGFECVVLNRRLLVIGGLHVPISKFFHFSISKEQSSECVLCFDPFFRKWTQLCGMKSPKSYFACAVLDGRVLVADCSATSTESFDPEKNTWEVSPEMPEPLYECQGITFNEQFQVLGYNLGDFRRHFILDGNEWKVALQTQELPSLEVMKTTQMDGRLYGIIDEGLVVLDGNTREWRIISEPPFFRTPGPNQQKPWTPWLLGLKGRFYLVSGTDMGSRNVGKDVLPFSTLRYCEPSAAKPVYWHDARPLLGGGGSVDACCALQQE